MAQSVAPSDDPLFTERWTIPFFQVPNSFRDPSIYYESGKVRGMHYGRLLDVIYEMADMLCTSNGIGIESAIREAMKAEEIKILPIHIALLAKIYKFDDEKPIRIEAMLNKKHLYSIGTQRGERKFNIEIIAANRRAAHRIALLNGFKVNDINMVG